jgi:hypothetical protein
MVGLSGYYTLIAMVLNTAGRRFGPMPRPVLNRFHTELF